MTQREERLILVVGATGNQGGAVADHLVEGGWRMRALTRQPTGEKAQALQARGVEVVQGDMEDPSSLDAAMEGAWGVFSVSLRPAGVEAEVRQGKNVAEAAKRNGVSHLVFTSVCGADRPTGVPHFESKRAIEAHIRSLDIPHTIVRPVSFMDNYLRGRDGVLQGRMTGPLRPTTRNQLIAVRDIGAFVAAAFARPDDFLGEAVNIAGDEVTMLQVAETFSRVLGQPVVYNQAGEEERQQATPETRAMNDWIERDGYDVDIPTLRSRVGIPLLTLEEWVRQTGWVA